MSLDLGFVRVDLERRTVHRPDGGTDRLTTIEAGLLRHLIERRGGVVGRDELFTQVWGYAPSAVSRVCDNTIYRLRQKIEADPADPAFLLTVHGSGYTLAHLAPEIPAPVMPEPTTEHRIALGDRILDLGRARVETAQGPIPLTAREIAVLEELLAARGTAVDRDHLQRRVWGSAAGRGLENVVSRLRRKLEPEPATPRVLLTTASGYRLETGAPADPVPATPRPTSALPSEVDARFGRNAEIDDIVARYAAGDRLVTLYGGGGAGKTRLALATAWQLSREIPAFWVDLSEARTTDRLAACLALALRLHLGDGDPMTQVGDAARSLGRVLLVLDNAEALVPEAVGAVGALLAQAADLWLLVTSRTVLGIAGERRIRVGPLLPDDAVALFLDRAPRAIPADDPDLRPLIAELDGLPLAIELAARRIAVFGVAELRQRLSDHRAVLAVSDPSRPPRHRSLRACLDGSWIGLSPAGQAAFAQLGVFAGPFDVDRAEGVLVLPDDQPVIDALQELVEASLVNADPDPGWFSLPHHVREYAREHLDPETTFATEARHRAVYAAFGRPEALLALDGPGEAEARIRLTRHLDNLVRAVEGALAADDGGNAVYAATACWEILAAVGPSRLALAWVPALATAPLEGVLQARARLLTGRIRSAGGSLAEARQDLLEAARLASRLGDAELGASAHLELADLTHTFDVEDEAASHAELASALARSVGRDPLIARASCAVGRSRLTRYQTAEAHEVLRSAMTAARASGSRRREAEARRWFGAALDRQGRPEALDELRRAARMALDLGDRRLEAEILRDMSALGAAQWLPWGAAALSEALRLFEAVGHRPGLADALITSAIHLLNVGHLDLAEEALDRADALAWTLDSPLLRARLDLRRSVLLRLRGRLEESEVLLNRVIALGDRRLARNARGQLGWNALVRKDFDEAVRVWRAEIVAAEALSDVYSKVNLMSWLGIATCGRDLDEAVRHWDEAARLAESYGWQSLWVHGIGNAASKLAEAGRVDEARERLQRLEAADLSEAPGIAIMRALVAASVAVDLGGDAARWLAEADHLADTHFDGVAMLALRDQVRERIGS